MYEAKGRVDDDPTFKKVEKSKDISHGNASQFEGLDMPEVVGKTDPDGMTGNNEAFIILKADCITKLPPDCLTNYNWNNVSTTKETYQNDVQHMRGIHNNGNNADNKKNKSDR